MKLAITGHTKGLGLAIYNHFKGDHEILGFSRSNGFDISSLVCRQQILEALENCDIFFNNAYNNFDNSQFILLKEVFTLWKNSNKIIVNISSRHITDNHPYCFTKKEQDIFCDTNIYKSPKIINLKPGLIDTPRVKNQNGNKMTTDQVLNILNFALQNDIRSITFGK